MRAMRRDGDHVHIQIGEGPTAAAIQEWVHRAAIEDARSREERLRAYLRSLPWPDRGRVEVMEYRPSLHTRTVQRYRLRSWGEMTWHEYQTIMQALWRRRELLDE